MSAVHLSPAEHAEAPTLRGGLPQTPGAGAKPVAKPRSERLWKPGQSGNPAGKAKGTVSKVTRTIKDAIETACQPGACHPEGLAGWLIERAQGGVQDRQIFAGLVAKVLPAQLQASVQHQGVVVQLGWLQGRSVGRNGTFTAQSALTDAQVIDVPSESVEDLRVTHTASPSDAPDPTPHPPQNPAAGGGE